jgi:putative MATE family efflux protein
LNPESIAQRWNNRALFRLLWPLIIEQILAVTIGVVDTIMVASIGEYAVSGVSLVDAINLLLIIAFGALATGGTVVVSQFIGRRDDKNAALASRQLIYASTVVSLGIMVVTLLLRRPLLRLIYGRITAEVMGAAETYFWFSALSYPFLAIYNAAASLFRSVGNSRVTMLVALLVNLINVAGNGILIYGFGMGVAGAALSTLFSRAAAALVLVILLMTRPSFPVSLRGLFRVRFDPVIVRSILNVGIPSGLESSMFQIGKILVSRIFTIFGTAAIAANAISGVINSFAFMPAQAFAIAMLTIVGQCIGARDPGSARLYTTRLMKLSHLSIFALSILILVFMNPLVRIFNLTAEAQRLAKQFLLVHCIFSPFSWPQSFTLPNALRAAGDSRYCMIVAVISMWTIRVSAAYLLCFAFGVGPVGVWLAMVADWALRAVCYTRRWRLGRWQNKTVIR